MLWKTFRAKSIFSPSWKKPTEINETYISTFANKSHLLQVIEGMLYLNAPWPQLELYSPSGGSNILNSSSPYYHQLRY